MVKNPSLSRRYRLKDSEVREVLEKAAVTMGNIDLTGFAEGLEIAKIFPQEEVLLIHGNPVFICMNGEVFPTLLNKEVLGELPTLTVDMGAVPHLCNGADLMAPGIVKVAGEFQSGAITMVIDVKFSKPIALVRTLYSSQELSEKKQGKVARNIHYVGDKFWTLFK